MTAAAWAAFLNAQRQAMETYQRECREALERYNQAFDRAKADAKPSG